jgi:mono/diheme cytochrome c family protein
MKTRFKGLHAVALCAVVLCAAGCDKMPGYPKPGPEVPRPDEVRDFNTLYADNCAGCHGANGRDGAALPLNNPAYLAIAGETNLRTVTANGVKGTLMPAFAQSAGGMLTEQQVDVLAKGMLSTWGKPAEFAGVMLPAYADSSPGNAINGEKVFLAACARCHGADGTGVKVAAGEAIPADATKDTILDASALALVSDQGLRSLILGGRPDENVPDWRTYLTGPGAHALSSQEVNDVVAWIASHRVSADGRLAQSTMSDASAKPPSDKATTHKETR